MSEPSANLEPRCNPYLLGHEVDEQFLLESWKNNSLHNSWLISGVEGIGKATFAYKFARFLLAANAQDKSSYDSFDLDSNHQIFKLVSNNSHPDMKIIERDYTDTDRRKIIKAIKDGEQLSADEMSGLKRSAFIRVDDVRTINDFLSKRSSQDGWRIVIIDSIDDMNSSSANAILKILEEPPHKTILLLISHNPNRLLPTIKSRCAKLLLKPLSDANLASLLRRYRPELDEKSIKGLVEICSGSIGKALNYADNHALENFLRLQKIVMAKSSFKTSDLLSFCDEAIADEDNYYLVQSLILKLIHQLISEDSKQDELFRSWDEALKIFSETESLNLDKKQALINIISNLCKRI